MCLLLKKPNFWYDPNTVSSFLLDSEKNKKCTVLLYFPGKIMFQDLGTKQKCSNSSRSFTLNLNCTLGLYRFYIGILSTSDIKPVMLHCYLVETDEYKMASEQEWPIPSKHYTFKTWVKNQYRSYRKGQLFKSARNYSKKSLQPYLSPTIGLLRGFLELLTK